MNLEAASAKTRIDLRRELEKLVEKVTSILQEKEIYSFTTHS